MLAQRVPELLRRVRCDREARFRLRIGGGQENAAVRLDREHAIAGLELGARRAPPSSALAPSCDGLNPSHDAEYKEESIHTSPDSQIR